MLSGSLSPTPLHVVTIISCLHEAANSNLASFFSLPLITPLAIVEHIASLPSPPSTEQQQCTFAFSYPFLH